LKYNFEKIIECVPNFSVGEDKRTIDLICNKINSVEYSKVLDVYSDNDTNRSVITFITTPDNLINTSFNAIKVALENINMETHSGVHPRIGAVDVFPIIPLKNISLKKCISLSKILGKKVSTELFLPVYLYGYSASSQSRIRLENVRRGEYEGLEDKIKNKKLTPDYGKDFFNKKSGATIIGVRNLLIAYNVNLNSSSKIIAQNIAKKIRESGYIKTNKNGHILYDNNKQPQREYGKLKNCKAIGWYSNKYKKAQVSFNITSFLDTPLHTLFDLTYVEALKNNVKVSGSEIVGLVPKDALLYSGKFYNKKNNKKKFSEKQLIELAVNKLGLNDLNDFNLNKKIIENFIL
tara:strand:- start:269 stop:1315 length:1047 start_codon:yes stop_codon:yes gene_type:complete